MFQNSALEAAVKLEADIEKHTADSWGRPMGAYSVTLPPFR